MYEKKTKTMSKLSKSMLGLMGLSLVTVAVSVNFLSSDTSRIIRFAISDSLGPSFAANDVAVTDTAVI